MQKYDQIDSFEFGQENPPAPFDKEIAGTKFVPSHEMTNEEQDEVRGEE